MNIPSRLLPRLVLAIGLLAPGPVSSAVETGSAAVFEQVRVSNNSSHPRKLQLLQGLMNESWPSRGCYLFTARYLGIRVDDGPSPAGKVTLTLKVLQKGGGEVRVGKKSGKPSEIVPGGYLLQFELEKKLSLERGDSLLWIFKFKKRSSLGILGIIDLSGQIIQFPDLLCDLR